MDEAMDLVQCYRCKEEKEPAAFSIDRARKNGLNTYCRQCLAAPAREFQWGGYEPLPDDQKWCPRCRTPKSRTDFGVARANTDGLVGWCRLCCAASKRERSDYCRDYRLRHAFGIDLNEFNRMGEKQGWVCYLCGLKCIGKPNLSVDHCHATGKVRSLLCGRCNQGLGMFREDVELMAKAIAYLNDHREAV